MLDFTIGDLGARKSRAEINCNFSCAVKRGSGSLRKKKGDAELHEAMDELGKSFELISTVAFL